MSLLCNPNRRRFLKATGLALISSQIRRSHSQQSQENFTSGKKTQMDSMRLVGVSDSIIVMQAQDLARGVSEAYLFNHVMRSWLFAATLSKQTQVPADPELLAVAALLHDLGLTAKYATDGNRFEVDGANAARAFLETHRITPKDVQLVWDAIALHSTRSIAIHKEPVVALCHSGVQVDISGLEYSSINPSVMKHILHDYPRLSLKAHLTDCLCSIVRKKPTTTYDNFMRDFGERYVPAYQSRSSVDRLKEAPFAR
jgi:hypothetical protein